MSWQPTISQVAFVRTCLSGLAGSKATSGTHSSSHPCGPSTDRTTSSITWGPTGLVIVAVGMGFYLSAATLNQAALAQGQARRAAACWLACAAGFIVWNLAGTMDVFRQVEVGFAAGTATLCGLLYLVYRRPHPHPGDELTPGSARELEAQLAAADEAA